MAYYEYIVCCHGLLYILYVWDSLYLCRLKDELAMQMAKHLSPTWATVEGGAKGRKMDKRDGKSINFN